MSDLSGVQEIKQTESPYYQAFKRMEDNKPPYPTKLVKKLGAYITGKGKESWSRQQCIPNFRGWAGAFGGYYAWTWKSIPDDVDFNNLNDIGYIGIWRTSVSPKDEYNKSILWCSLPSMRSGLCGVGETVDIGPERVRIGWKQEDLDAMVVQGYEIMMRMIAERGEYREDK